MAIKKTRRDVKRLAVRIGAELLIHSEAPSLDCELVAPGGYHWKCDPGVHALVGSQWEGESAGDVWADLWDRASNGVEPCWDTCEFWAE